MTELRAWVETLIEQHYAKVASRLSEKLEMSVSAFQRSTRNGTLSIENLLRLAEETGESASRVLRMGGKGELADLLERLYGPAAKSVLSKDGREVAQLFDRVENEQVRSFVRDALIAAQPPSERNGASSSAKRAGVNGTRAKRGNRSGQG